MDEAYIPPVAVLADRQKQVRSEVDEIVKWRRDVDKAQSEYANAIADLERTMRTVIRLLVGMMVTIVGASVSFALTILAAVGKL